VKIAFVVIGAIALLGGLDAMLSPDLRVGGAVALVIAAIMFVGAAVIDGLDKLRRSRGD
jgi:UDP-N-acetylglucosamine enolpyruvyl transferase